MKIGNEEYEGPFSLFYDSYTRTYVVIDKHCQLVPLCDIVAHLNASLKVEDKGVCEYRPFHYEGGILDGVNVQRGDCGREEIPPMTHQECIKCGRPIKELREEGK